MSIVSFAVIGYHFNHLDGQLNCQAFTHCIIGRATRLSTVQQVIVAWYKASTWDILLIVKPVSNVFNLILSAMQYIKILHNDSYF